MLHNQHAQVNLLQCVYAVVQSYTNKSAEVHYRLGIPNSAYSSATFFLSAEW